MSRVRSVVIMTFLWTVAATILGGIWGLGMGLFVPGNVGAVPQMIGLYAMVGGIIGVVGGGLFSLTLTRISGSVEELKVGTFGAWGTIAGALAGIGGYVLVSLMANGHVHYETAVLWCTAIGAVAGGATAATMLASAKRAPTLGAGRGSRELTG